MFVFKAISFLPLWALYLMTDFLFLIGYYLIGYRKKIILNNLRHAFPDKSEKEVRSIARKFFRNLTDSFAEIIKSYSITPEELDKRVKIINHHLVTESIEKNQVIIGLQGHFFNWEWHLLQMTANIEKRCDVVYAKVSNPFFEKLMMKIRTRFGVTMVEKEAFQRDFLRKRNQPRLIVLAADQRPGNRDIRYWTPFMNRDTAFFEGAEKLAKRFSHPVIYSSVSKPKRGHYVFNYALMDQPPYERKPEHGITDRFIALLEDNIRKEPEIYLWSHNRWKWKRGE
ncbi:lysophospholipid acyltransferase family protein [Arthrospiribacter ruber]|uniref:Lipid A biosynthesis acyltransferase n=1 Tax=Arthrospiribacter ruber TaxID=2487934 RepID=A0A951J2D7_9BACT|nr:lysophospholipid acyltransferase family protein [Arthrospiribacter ruber]MBW3470077.1 lipid A biosynthesis acyltransferase [Arthrospiribacter ruber]